MLYIIMSIEMPVFLFCLYLNLIVIIKNIKILTSWQNINVEEEKHIQLLEKEKKYSFKNHKLTIPNLMMILKKY